MELKKVIKDAAWAFYCLWIILMVGHLCQVVYSTISFFNQAQVVAMTTRSQLAEFFLIHFPQHATLLVLDFLIMVLMRGCMKKETPFMDKMFSRLKFIGFHLISAAVVQKTCVIIYNRCFSELLMDGTLTIAIRSGRIAIGSLGIVMLFLAVVIKYGIQLQQESDETL